MESCNKCVDQVNLFCSYFDSVGVFLLGPTEDVGLSW